MIPVDHELERVTAERRGAILAGLIALGVGVCVTSCGCQLSRNQLRTQLSSNQLPNKAVPQIVAANGSNALHASNSNSGIEPVHTAAYHTQDLEQSEQSEQPANPDLTMPVMIASSVTPAGLQDATELGVRNVDSLQSDDPSLKFPIDLTTALRLAGANHLQIELASERIREACARLDQAQVLWVPSVSVGVGFNRHDGPIQDTRGDVIDVSRQSLYFGGGPTVGSSPLSGGASGPARLFVDLSTADILFEPLAARQNVQAVQHARRVAENNNVLQVGLVYQELVRSQFQIGIAEEAIRNAEELVELTQNFADAGKGLVADAQRAKAELQQRLHQRAGAQERVAVNSAELVRLLRLDPSTRLAPVDPQPLPIELVETETPIEALIAQGLSRRPELAEYRARVTETMTRIEQEQWRPWLPHLYAGYAGAGFGGGRNSELENFGVRGDFDALAVWQVRNMGLGNRALQREKGSQHRQAHIQFEWIRDQVIAEIAQGYARVKYRSEQMEYAAQQVIVAADALPLNLKGIRDGVIRPIEAQQAIAGLAAARSLYLAAVIDFNQAQLELVRALGDAT